MPRILLTGVATLDIINQVSDFPVEDSEVRALTQSHHPGGNASNMATVLKQLDIETSLLASRADDSNADNIFNTLNERGIDTSLCPVSPNSTTPTSYITLNILNGSRTIVHYRQLPELTAEYVCQLDLSSYDWFHFEARECRQLKAMLEYVKPFNKTISIELEKPREDIELVYPYADILLISKPFAIANNFTNAADCVQHYTSQYPEKIISCTWGDQGAWIYDKQNIIHQPAQAIKKIVETLGAGDTYNAGLIASLLKHKPVKTSLVFACQLAAAKCQQTGFDNLPLIKDT